ncbi:hypothetical protein [Flammeovirga aprica]|uniref:TerB family tellurite resistance protein n=1 Tax=Flammeovirga aprica JL-4 TaxID=694437 RepID=A0A7X9P2Z9_9BACT|nr:hypothetical protein [Flammeovirga aprica]NME68616.1 hypothetical protein [Flammeovirga aprica JL-4]
MSIWKALENAVLITPSHQKLSVSENVSLKENELFLLKEDDLAARNYMRDLIKKTSENLYNTEHYEPYIIGLFAVGMAVARCDGRIVEEEKVEIKEFIDFVTNSELPQRYHDKIDAIKNMVFLNFNTAMSFVGQMHVDTWEVVDHLITLTIKADGIIATQEVEFYRKWKAWLASKSYDRAI